jgi:hypothetical protein
VKPRREPASVELLEPTDREVVKLDGAGLHPDHGRVSADGFGWGLLHHPVIAHCEIWTLRDFVIKDL